MGNFQVDIWLLKQSFQNFAIGKHLYHTAETFYRMIPGSGHYTPRTIRNEHHALLICHRAGIYHSLQCVKLAWWRLKSSVRLFVQQFLQFDMKGNSKTRVTGTLWGESTGK